ncbi:hypothetical protein, partial [Psychrobacillus lasiicapitis]
ALPHDVAFLAFVPLSEQNEPFQRRPKRREWLIAHLAESVHPVAEIQASTSFNSLPRSFPILCVIPFYRFSAKLGR